MRVVLLGVFFCLLGLPPRSLADNTVGKPGDAKRKDLYSNAQLLVRGDYAASQLPPKARGEWWAICPQGKRVVLKKVRAVFMPFADLMSGDAEDGEWTGRKVRTPGCKDSLALLRGLPGLSAREISSIPLPAFPPSEPTQGVDLIFQGAKVRLFWRGVEADEKRELVMQSGVGEHVIAQDEGADHDTTVFAVPQWKILWAGDLDTDGKLDFLLQQDDDGEFTTLYLSGGSDTPKAVAETRWGGC